MSYVRTIALAAAALAAVSAFALPASGATGDTRTITVTGLGEAPHPTTASEWTFAVRFQHRSAQAALRVAARRTARVAAALRDGGAADLRISELRVFPPRPAEDVGTLPAEFIAASTIEVTIAGPQRAALLADRAVAAGATQVSGPVLEEDEEDALSLEALADALDNAQAKARRLAAESGATLGGVMEITEAERFGPYGEAAYYSGPPGRLEFVDLYATVKVTFAVS